MSSLTDVAQKLVSGKRGILAADESTGTMGKRLEGVGVKSTEENRRLYRELLLTTPDLAASISGAILFDETIRQELSDGTSFPEALKRIGLLTGIKVDTGAKPLAGAPGETVTEGLDGLRERLEDYVALGASFTKWRAVYSIADGLPTERAKRANAHALARYAGLCQEAGLVPIVEPEVLMNGGHSLQQCQEVTREVLRSVFSELRLMGVQLEGIVLKPNMVVAGDESSYRPTASEVARASVETLSETVPPAVPGIAFLSGGQDPEEATSNLAAMKELGPLPWELTYSFGRALVGPALETWKGNRDQWDAAQKALADRAVANASVR